jgi:hypothetical protein
MAASGPIVSDSLYNGEVTDARLSLDDAHGRHFTHPHHGDAAPASSQEAYAGSDVPDRGISRVRIGGMMAPAASGIGLPADALLVPQNMPPIRRLRRLLPIAITRPSVGIHVIDFGQNSAGIVRTNVPAALPAGANITLYHGEVLNHPPYTPTHDGRVYRGNLRHAQASDVYVSDGRSRTWEPAFTQHGFR